MRIARNMPEQSPSCEKTPAAQTAGATRSLVAVEAAFIHGFAEDVAINSLHDVLARGVRAAVELCSKSGQFDRVVVFGSSGGRARSQVSDMAASVHTLGHS